MRRSQGLPKILLELPARVVPGLVLLAFAEYASGGRLWARLLAHVSAGLLGPDNAWAFAMTVGLVAAVCLGQLLDALGTLIEMASDALLRRPRTSADFDWLQVNEEHAADLAEEQRAGFKLSNSVAATLCLCCVVAAVASLRPALLAGLAVAALVAAWRGAVAKSAFQDRAAQLRSAAVEAREAREARAAGKAREDAG